MHVPYVCSFFFFFNDTATTEIYTLSLHDALPISPDDVQPTLIRISPPGGVNLMAFDRRLSTICRTARSSAQSRGRDRSEEHTSELQSRQYLVCRLLLEKKKKNNTYVNSYTKHDTE